ESMILGHVTKHAVLNVFNRAFTGSDLEEVVGVFQGGLKVDVSDVMPSEAYVRQIGEARPLHAACKKLGAKNPAAVPSAVEFVLEGLHLSRKLNKDVKSGQTSYRS